MESNRAGRAVQAAAFLLLAAAFYFYNSYVTVAGFGVGYQYVCCILIILLGSLWFLLYPVPEELYYPVRTSAVLASPYLVAMLCSAAIWIFDFTPIRQMISGFFEPAYIVLCIVCAAFLSFLFREQLVEYSFWALTAGFGIMVLGKVRHFGPAGYVRALMEFVRGMGSGGGGVSLEDTSLSYAYAFFALYFLFHRRGEPAWKQALRWAVIALGFAEVFKRSAMLALAAGIAAAWIYRRLPRTYRRLFRNFVLVGMVVFSFFIIPAIRTGLFTRIVNQLHINTSARTRIYAYYEQYYDFSLFYVGKGLGWIQRLVSSQERFNVGLESVNVHCDYVRFYIELGFAGYIAWMLAANPWAVSRTTRGGSAPDDAAALGVWVAMAVLRFTENVSQLYSANLALAIVIIQCCLNSRRAVQGERPG